MNSVEEAIQWTISSIDGIPDEYKKEAFSILLAYKLRESNVSEVDTGNQVPDSESKTEDWTRKVVEGAPLDHTIANNGNRKQQAMWAVIKLLENDEEANTASIRDTIKKQLGITPESGINTSMTLKNLTPKYLTREDRESGQGYAYHPTRFSLELFDGMD